MYEDESLRGLFTDRNSDFWAYLARRRSKLEDPTSVEKQRVTDQHYLAAGKRAIAEAFGTCEMLVIVGKDNLAVASTNATSSQALIIVARVAVNAAHAPRAPAAMMMATATKAEVGHARWPLLQSS